MRASKILSMLTSQRKYTRYVSVYSAWIALRQGQSVELWRSNNHEGWTIVTTNKDDLKLPDGSYTTICAMIGASIIDVAIDHTPSAKGTLWEVYIESTKQITLHYGTCEEACKRFIEEYGILGEVKTNKEDISSESALKLREAFGWGGKK